MSTEEFLQVESSQRQHHECIQHDVKMMSITEQAEFTKFAMLRPTLTKDGDRWCCLYGSDLQVGIAGFGDTPYKAVIDWNLQWNK